MSVINDPIYMLAEYLKIPQTYPDQYGQLIANQIFQPDSCGLGPLVRRLWVKESRKNLKNILWSPF